MSSNYSIVILTWQPDEGCTRAKGQVGFLLHKQDWNNLNLNFNTNMSL